MTVLDKPFLPKYTYAFLFVLLGLVYISGLFVPLMDNDSAHHANIALQMYLSGDYVNLVDSGHDYLDKPHLLFWLCALSYKVFGVTGFAYKLPSFLFTILGIYSTFRLGKSLYNAAVGRLAALILASACAFILANNDVRMDAILVACIAFATWQLVDFVVSGHFVNIVGAAAGLALGFSTKGQIAVLAPAIAIAFYILYRKDWKTLINWRWLALILLFGLLISPVLYCYYLQFNLHPEKVVRGQDHINGVRFILFSQSTERFNGNHFGGASRRDYFFFLHSFLWAFSPWSIIAALALVNRISFFRQRGHEWLTSSMLLILLILLSFSGFKLPHYLNIVFPAAAILVAAFILEKIQDTKWIKILFYLQFGIAIVLLVLITLISAWAFPVKHVWVLAITVLLLALVFYYIKTTTYTLLQKAALIPVATMILCFFLLNCNFYPQLLKYQAGNELAFSTKGKVDPENLYFWKENYSSSYNFYTATLRKPFTDSVLKNNRPVWLLLDVQELDDVKKAGYSVGQTYSHTDYWITRLDFKFINPSTRDDHCTTMLLAEITGSPKQN